MGRHSPRQHKIAGSPPCPPQQGLCVWWKARPAWEDLLHLICAKEGYTCFAGGGRGWGWGGRGSCDLFLRYFPGTTLCHLVARGLCLSTHHFQGLQGWEEGAVGRRHEGTEFWGTNPRRNSLREPTCVQGGQKKLHPAHGKTHPLVRKHTSVWGSQQRGENTRPQLFKGPGPEKIKGLSARERRIAVRKPMST